MNNVDVFSLDESPFGQVCKEQITNLTLVINENDTEIDKTKYTKNVYAPILAFFENLKSLSITSSCTDNSTRFWSFNTPTTVFVSSTLTKLCINVYYFTDCLLLLDGRLKQLTTLIVDVHFITSDDLPTFHNQVSFEFMLLYSFYC